MRLEKHVADMVESFRLMHEKFNRLSTSADLNGRRTSLVTSTTQNIHSPNMEPGKGRSGIQSNYSGMTRLPKLDFPRFNDDELKEWLYKVEQFYAMDNIPDDIKVGLASIHFDGLASKWH